MLTCVESKIRELKGKSNADLRRRLREAAQRGVDSLEAVRRNVALSVSGRAKVDAIIEAVRHGCRR
jgi:hypothetical protein